MGILTDAHNEIARTQVEAPYSTYYPIEAHGHQRTQP